MTPIRSRLLCTILLPVFVIAACAPGRGLPPLPPVPSAAYRLGPGDEVRIITVGEDTLTGEFGVDDSGRIAVPMLGSVRAAGLSPEALGAVVGAALQRAGLVRSPSVSVEVIRYRPIFVLGEVNKPGEFPYEPGMTVLGRGRACRRLHVSRGRDVRLRGSHRGWPHSRGPGRPRNGAATRRCGDRIRAAVLTAAVGFVPDQQIRRRTVSFSTRKT